MVSKWWRVLQHYAILQIEPKITQTCILVAYRALMFDELVPYIS